MNPKMRAKLRVDTITQTAYGDVLKLCAQYSESKEDNSYAEATPSASLEMTINNPALRGAFKVGETFYVDFTPVAHERHGD